MSRTIRDVYPPYEGEYDSTRDGKKTYKPGKKFKYYAKRGRKAKEKQAMRRDEEIIPDFPKSDIYDWN